jgi:probable F420-dependent oxidoreductase
MTLKMAVSLGALNPNMWAEVTEEADRLGFDSVWLPEHLVLPVEMSGSPHAGQDHPPIPPDIPVFDAFTYLAFLAGRTSRIRFGTQVYNIGLRHPFISARAVATLDIVSGGRLDFGIGASWLEAEWRAMGLDFRSRGRRVDETLTVCQLLWNESVIEHHGEFFNFDKVMFEPKPVQRPCPPIIVGGDSPAALRRTAQFGDGWIPMNHTLEQIPASVARLAELRESFGRPGRTEVTLGGQVDSLADVERYVDAGVDRVIVRPWRRSREAIEGLRRFAGEVLDPAGAAHH